MLPSPLFLAKPLVSNPLQRRILFLLLPGFLMSEAGVLFITFGA